MTFSIQSLVGEHREVQAALDLLAASVAQAGMDLDLFRRAHWLCLRHYEHEESFLVRLSARDAVLAAKLRGQHDEAVEVAEGIEEAVSSGQAGDARYLVRRFLAIAQHNMIEEERDVFPFAGGV